MRKDLALKLVIGLSRLCFRHTIRIDSIESRILEREILS